MTETLPGDGGSVPGGLRALRRRLGNVLEKGSLDQALGFVREVPARSLVGPLRTFFFAGSSLARWRSVTLFGWNTARLAQDSPEDARIIMRQLMWTLNDESGGIGWSSPEAMGESMARSRLLAGEYVNILLSYLRKDGNYLEYRPLRLGALWGVSRVAEAFPDMLAGVGGMDFVRPYGSDIGDPYAVILCAMTAGRIGDEKDCPWLNSLVDSPLKAPVYWKWDFQDTVLGSVARSSHFMLCE